MSVMVPTAPARLAPATTWAMPTGNLAASTRRWRCTRTLLNGATHFLKIIFFTAWCFWVLVRPSLQRARSRPPGRIFKLLLNVWVKLRGKVFIAARSEERRVGEGVRRG